MNNWEDEAAVHNLKEVSLGSNQNNNPAVDSSFENTLNGN